MLADTDLFRIGNIEIDHYSAFPAGRKVQYGILVDEELPVDAVERRPQLIFQFFKALLHIKDLIAEGDQPGQFVLEVKQGYFPVADGQDLVFKSDQHALPFFVVHCHFHVISIYLLLSRNFKNNTN